MNRDTKATHIKRSLNRLASEHPLKWTVNDLRIIFGLERIVARLQSSPPLSKHLIFKGGFVLLKAYDHDRFTRDVDALGQGIDQDKVRDLILAALELDLDDGLWFGDIQSELLEFTGEYGTLRFDCAFQIGQPPADQTKWRKLSRLHFDIGFSDRVPRSMKPELMKSIFNSDDISWKIYPAEYIFAEKLETLITRGSANSRAKDVYDLLFLLKRKIDHAGLGSAIHVTFLNRKTPLPESIASQLETFDTTVLEAAWKSMSGKAQSPTPFKVGWRGLIEKMKSLKLEEERP